MQVCAWIIGSKPVKLANLRIQNFVPSSCTRPPSVSDHLGLTFWVVATRNDASTSKEKIISCAALDEQNTS